MIESRQLYRLLAFGYMNVLPNILSFWVLAIIPEILTNNFHMKDPQQISIASGYFFVFFFLGIIVGALIWPTVIFYISKRTALLVGLIGMCTFNYLVGVSTSVTKAFLFRFFTGMFHNFNSVGKDFIFQFARPSYRQYGFSVKTLFGILTSFMGPFIGHWIYTSTNGDFRESMKIITLLFIIGIVIFIIVFFLDFKPGDATYDLDVDEEEVRPALIRSENDTSFQKGLLPVFRLCIQNTYLRNLSIVYFLTNGVYKCGTIVAVLYLETAWERQGYGMTSQNIANAAFLSFFPAAFLVIVSPSFVPTQIPYKSFIRFFIILMGVTLILFPLVRDLIPERKGEMFGRISLFLLIGFFGSIPKLYSPFINFNLNNAVDKYSRTALNSITFIFSTSSTALMTLTLSPLMAISLFSPVVEGHVEVTKYLVFVILDFVLAGTLIVLSKI